jgi:TolB protein
MRIFLLLLIFLYLNADELKITKYITNQKPKIYVEYVNSNKKLNHMLKIDSKIISHYDMKIGGKTKSLTHMDISKYKGYNYLLRINYKNKILTALLYDLIAKKIKLYKKYKIPNFNSYPFMIHALSYDINSKLGFNPIPWIKRKIVYSVNMAPKENAIFIADITLTYRKKLISGGFNIFPKWANKSQTEIYYTKYLREPTLFKYNIYTGKKTRIMSSNGMLIVSDVDFNNHKLLLTLAPNDQPDIYEYNLDSRKLNRITKYIGIDVNGHFYGNNSILFISNRLGNPNVYQKNLDSGIVKKVIYYSKNQISLTAHNNAIVISSRETNKAFSNNSFNLLLINKNNNNVKRLTFGGKNISPVFSNDGSSIFFIKEYNFNSKIGIIRLKEKKIFYFRLSKIIQSFDY